MLSISEKAAGKPFVAKKPAVIIPPRVPGIIGRCEPRPALLTPAYGKFLNGMSRKRSTGHSPGIDCRGFYTARGVNQLIEPREAEVTCMVLLSICGSIRQIPGCSSAARRPPAGRRWEPRGKLDWGHCGRPKSSPAAKSGEFVGKCGARCQSA